MQDYPILVGNELQLVQVLKFSFDPIKNWLPYYQFEIQSLEGERLGGLNFRVGYMDSIVYYAGHIGYGIDPKHRGNRYAAKACQTVKQIAQDYHMDCIWITCDPDNWASRKTCELVGATFVEIVDLPSDNEMYLKGDRQRCRYRWIIY